MEDDKFKLEWNNFENKVGRSYKILLGDPHFADVTLVCDDDKQIKAHKVVLSSLSQKFQNILMNNSHPHPLIYFRKIEFSLLEALVHFIYLGRVEVKNEALSDFINLANEFEVEGLKHNQAETVVELNVDTRLKNMDYGILEKSAKKPDKTSDQLDFIRIKDESQDVTENSQEYEFRELEALEVSSATENYSLLNRRSESEKNYEPLMSSNVIEKNIKRCDDCNKTYGTDGGLWLHKMSAHKGVRFPCRHCDYGATTKSNLKRHISKYHTDVDKIYDL